MPDQPHATDERGQRLRADCERCVGLCCVAPAFAASADFAIDKPAGRPCPNLRADFRCDIHAQLRPRGFPGCVAYDCFGAGQKVTQDTFAGRDWRRTPQVAGRMFEVFTIMRHLHELLWYLAEALTLSPARPLQEELRDAVAATERLTRGSPDELLAVDVTAHRRGVLALLGRVSTLARSGKGRAPVDRSGEDLIGANLRDADLRGTDLRGTYLIGANLRGADLRAADLMGADLRGADLSAADLSGTIFLTRPQLAAAMGDHATRLPPALERPAHWSAFGAEAQRRQRASRPRRRNAQRRRT